MREVRDDAPTTAAGGAGGANAHGTRSQRQSWSMQIHVPGGHAVMAASSANAAAAGNAAEEERPDELPHMVA
jgi:hypothetical protein